MKQEIREKLLYKRTTQSPRDKKPKDKKIVESIESLPEFQKAKKILIYMAINGEVDTTDLFEKYKEEKQFILPRVNIENTTLTLYHIKSLEDLEKGTFRIPEPSQDLEKVKPEEIDLAIIPGIAFAKNGHRIGYGGGFYDKLLKKINCPTIGIAYEFQIIETIPTEDHDEKTNILITENNIIHISTS